MDDIVNYIQALPNNTGCINTTNIDLIRRMDKASKVSSYIYRSAFILPPGGGAPIGSVFYITDLYAFIQSLK